jgi:GNAT superfamily N-acetyltransferase
VTEQARGAGIFAALMMTVEQHARIYDIQELSVCTYPGKFGKMFAILQKTGWKVWAWMEGGEKVLMHKTVL